MNDDISIQIFRIPAIKSIAGVGNFCMIIYSSDSIEFCVVPISRSQILHYGFTKEEIYEIEELCYPAILEYLEAVSSENGKVFITS